MNITREEKDIIKMLIKNELEYYDDELKYNDNKEYFDEVDKEYVEQLNVLLMKLEEENR